MRRNPDPTPSRRPAYPVRIRVVPDTAEPPDAAGWSHDKHTARSTAHPARRRTPRDPRPDPRPRPSAAHDGQPEVRRRRRRRRRPAPRHRPRDRARAVRGAHLLRRRRAAALRRPVAADARGRRRPGDDQPGQAQPRLRPGGGPGPRRGAAGRRLVGRLRVPLAADHRRHRGGRRAADPGPAREHHPGPAAAVRRSSGPGVRPGPRDGRGGSGRDAVRLRLPGPDRDLPDRTRRRRAVDPAGARAEAPGPAPPRTPAVLVHRWR